MKTLWQSVGNNCRRIAVEFGRLEFEYAQKEYAQRDRKKPKKSFKASTIALICAFLSFAALILWLSHRTIAAAIR
jgi:hypothetical protein